MINIATDCSGLDTPLLALNQLQVPYRHIFSSEIDPLAVQLLQANFQPEILFGDITKRDWTKHDRSEFPSIDLYVAGFPCQPFSTVGTRSGFEDERGHLFVSIYHTIVFLHPKCFLLENVAGLLVHHRGHTFSTIMSILQEGLSKDYDIQYKVLDTQDYGLPQQRKRVYIVGTLRQLPAFRFPEPIPLTKTIYDIIEPSLPLARKKTYSKLTSHMKYVLSKANIEHPSEPWIINLNTSHPNYATKKKSISPTLLAGMFSFYVTSLGRKLTPRECMRLQGIPDSFDTCGFPDHILYRLTGNAMSVNVLVFLFRECWFYRSKK